MIDFSEYTKEMKRRLYQDSQQDNALACFHDWQECDVLDQYNQPVGYYRICKKCEYGEKLMFDDDGNQYMEPLK